MERGRYLRTFLSVGWVYFVAAQSSAWAANSTIQSSDVQGMRRPQLGAPGLRLYGGAALGYGAVAGSEFESAPGGPQLLLGGTLSYYFSSPWVVEAGLGWFYSRASGLRSSRQSVDIVTRAAVAEVSPRYRLGERWQIGPSVNVAFGTDTSFGPHVGESVATAFVGAKGVYEFAVGSFPMRVWQQVLTDVNAPGRHVVLVMAGVQFGLPVRRPLEWSERIRYGAAHPVIQSEEVRVRLDPKRVFFKTNSSELNPRAAAALSEVAGFLNKHGDLWQSVEIGGHADQRGGLEYNRRLSRKRADAVRVAFLEGGVEAERMELQAFSYLKPIDSRNNPEAWARNRRVELIFRNVRDHDDLIQRLKESLHDMSPEFKTKIQ